MCKKKQYYRLFGHYHALFGHYHADRCCDYVDGKNRRYDEK